MDFRRRWEFTPCQLFLYFLLVLIGATAYATDCTVEHKVLRDGIVGTPLPSDAQFGTDLELSSADGVAPLDVEFTLVRHVTDPS